MYKSKNVDQSWILRQKAKITQPLKQICVWRNILYTCQRNAICPNANFELLTISFPSKQGDGKECLLMKGNAHTVI